MNRTFTEAQRIADEERMWADRDRVAASENTRPASIEDLWPTRRRRARHAAVELERAA